MHDFPPLEDTMPFPDFGRNSETCDKCKQHVPLENSTLFLEWILGNCALVMFAQSDRHLLPVGGDWPCEGSPSRAQYIEGQQRDPRGLNAYAYHPELEEEFREAFAKMMATTKPDEPDVDFATHVQ